MRHSGLPGKTGIGFGETIFAPRARAFLLNLDPTSDDANQAAIAGEKTSLSQAATCVGDNTHMSSR
jgi:hypothetical protein